MHARLVKPLFLLGLGIGWDRRRKRMIVWASCIALAFLTLCMASPSSANMATYNVSFSASGFSGYNAGGPVSTPAPIDPFTGSFTITFDPTVDTSGDTTTGGSFTGSFALNPGFTLGYTNFGGTVMVGGMSSTNWVNQEAPGTNDFVLIIDWSGSNPTYDFFSYSAASTPDVYVWDAYAGSVCVEQGNLVPVPGALVLFGSGLLGLVGWRRFRKG
jgi:hypothetical protein